MFSSYRTAPIANLKESYDFIIVGGGTAGCVLANRLSQYPDVTVLLIERGGVQNSWISRVPLFSSHFASDGSRSRVWKSTMQESVSNRTFDLIGGASLGGSSKINAMLYTRGIPGEYNSWGENGSQGWAYDDILPFFTRSETDLDQGGVTKDDWHSTSGEWMNRSHKTPFWAHTEHIIQATANLGVPYVDDLNSPHHPPHGCAKMHYSIDSRGERSSTLSAFLPRTITNTRGRHLDICTHAVARRIEVVNHGDAVVAEGVSIQSTQGPSARFVRANREIILAAGPLSSPHLLLLSGIGPARHLKEHGISVVKDLPGVGSSLQDHLAVPLQFQIPPTDSLAKLTLRPWIIIKEFILYLLFGIGLLLSPVLELSIFIQTRLLDGECRTRLTNETDADARLPQNLPDIEIMPISWGDVSEHRSGGLTFFTVGLRPKSAGTVRLASSDPFDDPIIDPKYLSHSEDWSVMRQGIRFVMRLKDQMVRQGYPIQAARVPASEDDSDLDDFIRNECRSTSHYTSTCRMAPQGDSTGGVVDERLKVHGISGLRVGDSSAFPCILSTHLAAPTVALAEKCAFMVIEDAKLARNLD